MINEDVPDDKLAYVLALTVHDYAELMRLVMRYGTGAGEGGGTPITFRQNLAAALCMTRARANELLGGKTSFAPQPVPPVGGGITAMTIPGSKGTLHNDQEAS